MSIRQWDLFDELQTLRESLDGAVGEIFARRLPVRLGSGIWKPAAEIFATEDEIVVRAELPGVNPKQLAVSIVDGLLTIKAEARAAEEERGRAVYRRELRYGTFERLIVLPVEVRADRASATYKHGILEVRIPKAEEAKRQAVTVQVAA